MRTLIVPHGRDRLCALQVCFHGNRRREYLIHYTPGGGFGKDRREGSRRACSLADIMKTDELDLRQRLDAEALAHELAERDLDDLIARMENARTKR